MKYRFLNNASRPLSTPLKVGVCDTFITQLRGLLFRPSLPEGEGLLLMQKKDSRLDAAIHMIGMAFDIGVVWINSTGHVVDLRLAKRWRLYFPRQSACWTLEIHPNRLTDFHIGDKVYLDEGIPA